MTSATHDAPALLARTELSLPHTHVETVFVDGAWQPSRGTGRNPVTDPATGEVWGSVPDGTPDDVDAAVGSAQRAFQGEWPRLTPSERAVYLLRIADEVETRAEELSLTNSRENGSPVAESSVTTTSRFREASRLQGPGPAAAMSRKTKQ